MHAPNLTGLGSAYVVQQLRNFRAAHRGNSSDTYGFMMIGRANALPDDRALRDVAAFIDTLRAQPSVSDTLTGKAERGRSLYAACASCHGSNAEGIPELGAPPLRQQDAGYLSIQMQHFASGVRGANPADIRGAQMRAAAKALPDSQAVADVIAYIKSR
jgi:cytochrome c oxidase subunit 2